MIFTKRTSLTLYFLLLIFSGYAGNHLSFKVIAFYTAKNDPAHISFVHEANRWFEFMGPKKHFRYKATNNWNDLNSDTLKNYQVVIFLDVRPDSAWQRNAFQQYMENGGSFMGFHFSAFALTPSSYPQNWDWYHNTFLGSGEYLSNTWRPTSAILKVETHSHPATRYPVVWTNTLYRMIYINMGHNDIDYEHHTNKEQSLTFANKYQNRLVMDALIWLGTGK